MAMQFLCSSCDLLNLDFFSEAVLSVWLILSMNSSFCIDYVHGLRIFTYNIKSSNCYCVNKEAVWTDSLRKLFSSQHR